MKTNFFAGIIIFCLGIVVLFSCNKENNIHQPTKKVDASTLAQINGYTNGCPPGYHAEMHYEFDAFNFHRPVNGCARGFWFCFKNGHWEKKCVSDLGGYSVATIDGTTAYIWGDFISDSEFEMHFPDALLNDPNYTEEDLENLNVDDEWEIFIDDDDIHYKLATGTYPVSHIGDELVAVVDVITEQ